MPSNPLRPRLNFQEDSMSSAEFSIASDSHKAVPAAKPQRRRSISFHNEVKVFLVPNVKDLDDHVTDNLWWRGDDFESFREECRYTMKAMLATDDGRAQEAENNYTLCGLESFLKGKSNERRRRRSAAFKAVLREQRAQWDEGTDDPDFISQVYREFAIPSLAEANEIALQHQGDVFKLVQRRTTL